MTFVLTLGLIGVLLLGIGLAQPLYVILAGLSGMLLFFGTNVYTDFTSLDILIEQTRALSDNEVLLAIPFFVISGALMSAGDISRRLVDFASVSFRGVPGALAVSAVMGCIFFAAISGSSPVTVIAIGSIVYPSMMAKRYSSNFSSGLLASAGSLGILLPPSIPMIVYSIVDPSGLMDPPNYNLAKEGQQTGLTDLFLAGVAPGLMIGMVFVFASIIHGARMPQYLQGQNTFINKIATIFKGMGRFLGRIPVIALVVLSGFWVVVLLMSRTMKTVPAWMEHGTWLRDFVESFWASFWALMLPTIILGGIYSGTFTPTEAACVSVIYALLVELFIYRSITLPRIPAVFSEATVLIGSLLIILAVAQGFNRYLEDAEIPQKLVQIILDMQLSTVAFLMVVNILLLVVGCFMDIMSAILILVPLLSPVAYQLGIHPVHLAIVFIVNLEIGYLTPPLGMNLFVASTIFKKNITEVMKSVVPFMGMMFASLMLITYVPTIALGPVSLINGHGFYVPFPERKVPMRSIHISESVTFLSHLADEEDEAQVDDAPVEDAAPAAPGRALTMAELTRLAALEEQEEAASALSYDNTGDLLHDFLRLHTRQTNLPNLLMELEERLGAGEDDWDPYDYDDEDDDFDPYDYDDEE